MQAAPAAVVLAAAVAGAPSAGAAGLGVQDDRLTSGPVAEAPARVALVGATGAPAHPIAIC